METVKMMQMFAIPYCKTAETVMNYKDKRTMSALELTIS